MALAQCAEFSPGPPLPYISDADLLDPYTRRKLTQQARNLYRNLTLALLRRGHTYLYVSDEFAASMAKCSAEKLSGVLAELSGLGLLQVRETHRFPRYALSGISSEH